MCFSCKPFIVSVPCWFIIRQAATIVGIVWPGKSPSSDGATLRLGAVYFSSSFSHLGESEYDPYIFRFEIYGDSPFSLSLFGSIPRRISIGISSGTHEL